MTWDFSTDPDFQKHLDWMNDFVRAEVWPLETLDLSWPDLRRAIAPLRERVKARGLWAAHLGPEHGGKGFGQVKLGLMHEILGTSPFGPLVFGNQAPDSGNAEILARSGTAEQKRR
jgi:acyl-CoA dehydrogenase